MPALVAVPGHAGTVALLGSQGLAALTPLDDQQLCELAARPLGREARPLARRLVAHVQDCDTHRRPATTGLHVAAYRRDTDRSDIVNPDSTVIHKRYRQVVLDQHHPAS